MLAPGIKDTTYCHRGNHSVPRAEITKMLNDTGTAWVRLCKDCKDAALVRRAKAKNALKHC